MEYKVEILNIQLVTHDVYKYLVKKPDGYTYTPGQATLVGIDDPKWIDIKHPFTFTSLNSDKELEFTIKSYDPSLHPTHSGMTNKLPTLKIGDQLIIEEPWGTIQYKGKGVYIAGGAGITPFIAILRELNKNNEIAGNKLIYSNKTEKDIIYHDELVEMFKENPSDLILTLTREENSKYRHGRIDAHFLKNELKTFNTNFYICGPKDMKNQLISHLNTLEVDSQSIVFEN
jgi:ferredoxin-NADP reductase